MNAPAKITKATSYSVGSSTVPPWDRTGGAALDLTPLVGEVVATGPKTAARLLGSKLEGIRSFLTEGILREGRIVEAPFKPSGTTFVCVTACYWSRLFLEPGESLVSTDFGEPGLWRSDSHGRDVEGRVCVRIRAIREGSSDDLTIVTDRRTYRIRLIGHATKVTIGCSWTYPAGVPAATPAGETRRWWADRAGTIRPTRFILFELGKPLREHVMDWAHTIEPRKTWQLRKYKTLRRRANVPAEDPHPPAIITAVLQRLMEVGTISEPEIRQWLEVPGNGQATVDMFNELATGRRRNRLPLPAGLSPTSQDMLDPFPFLSDLPETCYEDEETFAEATDRARAIAWVMDGLAPAGALFCAVAPRYFRGSPAIERILHSVATLERISASAGLDLVLGDAASVDAAAIHLLDSPDCSHLSEATRCTLLWSLRMLVRTLRRYIRFRDPDDAYGLAAMRPAELSRALTDRLYGLMAAVGRQCRDNRKERVFKFAGKLSDLDFAADLNLEQVVLATKALASGEKEVGARDCMDLPVQMTIVDHRGRLQPGKQICTWRIWKPLPYHRLLRSRTSDRKEIERLDAAIIELEAKVAAGMSLDFIHEYRHTRGVAGSTPIEPFHVKVWRYGLIARPARIPARLRHKRHMLLRELKLPGCVIARSELLAGTETQMDLWRVSVRQKRTIAYLDAFEHALRFAHFGLSSVFENFSRTTAWMQQTQDQSGWETRPLAGVKVAGFLAHDKQTGELKEEMTWFPVGPAHQKEGMALAAMTCRRCGYDDGMLPEVPHLAKEQWKRPGEQAWLFVYGGSVLVTSYLHRYLRFLLPLWGKITFHDFRHLGANAAYEDGVPGWIIRLTLNHGMTNMWEYYAEQSAAQNAKFEESFLWSRFERSALARSSRAVAQKRYG